jgi:hypothetical protein
MKANFNAFFRIHKNMSQLGFNIHTITCSLIFDTVFVCPRANNVRMVQSERTKVFLFCFVFKEKENFFWTSKASFVKN